MKFYPLRQFPPLMIPLSFNALSPLSHAVHKDLTLAS